MPRLMTPFLLLWICLLASVVRAGQPEARQLLGQWQGVDPFSRPGEHFRLDLEIRSVNEIPLSDNDLLAYRVEGQIQVQALSPEGGQNPLVISVAFMGRYQPVTGILSYEIKGTPAYAGVKKTAVLNDVGDTLAVVGHSAGASRHPAFVLTQNASLAAEVLRLAEPRSNQRPNLKTNKPAADVVQQRAASVSRRGVTASVEAPAGQKRSKNPARAEYQQRQKALQQQIQEAVRARDKELTAQLRQELKQLRKDYREKKLAGTSGKTTRTQAVQRMKEPCPEPIVNWTNHLIANGDSNLGYRGDVQLSNLFRPQVYASVFGKRFSQTGADELKQLLEDLQLPCKNDGSALAKSMVRQPLSYVISDRKGFGWTEAGIGGVAAEVVAEWQQRLIESLQGAGAVEVEEYVHTTKTLLSLLWPIERDSTGSAILARRNNLAVTGIDRHLGQLGQRIANGEVDALTELYHFPESKLFKRLLPEELDRQKQRFFEAVDQGVNDFVAPIRSQLAKLKSPTQRLAQGRAWYFPAATALERFNDRHTFQQFENWFYSDRDRDFKAGKSELLGEIDALAELLESLQWSFQYKLPRDSDFSQTWLEVEAHLFAKQEKLEHEHYLARVGEGPFGPHDPGAIYLNAVIRMDREQIKAEDRLFALAYQDVVPFASGYSSRSSLVQPLLVFIAASWGHVYQGCMDKNYTKYTRTTQYENVVTNGWGAEISRYPTYSTTTTWRINDRHKPMFRMSDGNIPGVGSMKMAAAFLGGDKQKWKIVDDLLEGSLKQLRKIMQTKPCNDVVLQTIDENLITLWHEKYGG
jgi:hypothetical protein